MWHKKQKPKQKSNPVAKYAKVSGAGSHRDHKNDYNRQKFKLAKDE